MRARRRVQVERLVRLHDPIGPAGVIVHLQVDRSERPNRRSAHGRDQSRQLRKPARCRFVDAARRLLQDPGGFGPRLPVTPSRPSKSARLSRRRRTGAASGELQVRVSGCAAADAGWRPGYPCRSWTGPSVPEAWREPFLIIVEHYNPAPVRPGATAPRGAGQRSGACVTAPPGARPATRRPAPVGASPRHRRPR